MHEDMTLLMSLALDGEASSAEEARLQAHLAMCPACATTWEDWKAADRLFAKAPSVAPSPDLLAGLAARLEMVDARRQRIRWVAIALTGVGLLLCALMLSTAGLYLGWSRQSMIVEALLSGMLRLSAGIVWTLRGLATVARSADWQGVALSAGVYLTLAGGLLVAWLCLVGRSQARSARRVTARSSRGDSRKPSFGKMSAYP